MGDKRIPVFREQSSQQPLNVNTSSQHYVQIKSEQAGIADLRRMVAHQKVEEIWILVKTKNPSGKSVELWYEVGINEKPESCGFQGKDIPAILQDLKKRKLKLQAWSHYHFHPQGKNPYKANIPSEKDYFTLDWINGANRVLKWGLPRGGVKVVTGSGLWDFQLKKNHPAGTQAQEKFSEDLLQARVDLSLLRMKGMTRCIEDPVKNCRPKYSQIGGKVSTPWSQLKYFAFPQVSTPQDSTETPKDSSSGSGGAPSPNSKESPMKFWE